MCHYLEARSYEHVLLSTEEYCQTYLSIKVTVYNHNPKLCYNFEPASYLQWSTLRFQRLINSCLQVAIWLKIAELKTTNYRIWGACRGISNEMWVKTAKVGLLPWATERLLYGNWKSPVFRKWKWEVDLRPLTPPPRSTGVNLGKKQKCCSSSFLWFLPFSACFWHFLGITFQHLKSLNLACQFI